MPSDTAFKPSYAGAAFGAPDAVIEALTRWLELSQVERRAFAAMTEEIATTSAVIEDSTIDLSNRFHELAEAAEAQSTRVQRVAEIAKTVQVKGQRIDIAQATGFVETALGHAIDALMRVSGQAIRMAETLTNVERDVTEVEHCATRIDAINRQARFVALNASIEAQRAEGSGGAFKVIAQELRVLSQETDAASRMVRDRIGSVATAVRTAHRELTSIADTDMSRYVETRGQLSAVLAGIAQQSNELSGVLDDAVSASSEVSSTISRLVTGIQFQDRAKQHLAHVIGVVEALGEAIESLQHHTRQSVPRLARPIELNSQMLHRLVEQQTLGAVRERFLAHLLDDTPKPAAAPVAPTEASGDIELWD